MATVGDRKVGPLERIACALKRMAGQGVKAANDLSEAYEAIKTARAEKFLLREKPLSGRALDVYARETDGLERKPGETDEQFRHRCMMYEAECYAGSWVIPLDGYQRFFHDNDKKQEGDAQ